MRFMFRMNGYDIRGSVQAKFNFVMKVAVKELSEQEMTDWIRRKCKPCQGR